MVPRSLRLKMRYATVKLVRGTIFVYPSNAPTVKVRISVGVTLTLVTSMMRHLSVWSSELHLMHSGHTLQRQWLGTFEKSDSW